MTAIKKTVLYIGYRTDLLPKSKLKRCGEEKPIVEMVKKACPTIVFDDIYVDTVETIHNDSAFDALVKDCASGKIKTIVVPSFGSLATDPLSLFDYVHRFQKADPNINIHFALEKVNTKEDDFSLKTQIHYMAKDEYATMRRRKREFTSI